MANAVQRPRILLRPIGMVRSPISEPEQMPPNGVEAVVEVFPEFAPALAAIETNSHLIVLGWFHLARRGRLLVGGQSPTGEQPLRGVFGLRSSDRPNPIGLNVARLLGVDGARLSLDRLDMVDATPVVDVKRYSPGWDCVFSARTSRELRPPGDLGDALVADLLLEAEHFHGELCAGAQRAALMVRAAARRWGISPKDPRVRVEVGDDGCLADALQAMCTATLGSGRLIVQHGDTVRLLLDRDQLTFSSSGELLAEG